MNAINHSSSPLHDRSVLGPLEEEGMEMDLVHIHHMLLMYHNTQDRIRQGACGLEGGKALLS